jgi:hypothetical protein
LHDYKNGNFGEYQAWPEGSRAVAKIIKLSLFNKVFQQKIGSRTGLRQHNLSFPQLAYLAWSFTCILFHVTNV